MQTQRIVIAGAGLVGCFVGGMLAAAGRDVALLGRGPLLAQIAQDGLLLSDFGGMSVRARPAALSADPQVLASAHVVLVTVKTGATGEMAGLIERHAPGEAVIVSLQNGLEAVRLLRHALPGRDIRGGMVPFNVVPEGAGHFHRATSGEIVIGAGPGHLGHLLSVPGLSVIERADMEAVQWGKLVINLNNALNALSGLTLHQQLQDREWRCLMADQMAEALAVLRKAQVPVVSMSPVPSGWIAPLLRLPTPLFRRVAAQMLTVDPRARTSMAYDLRDNRPTEVAALQGAVLELARQVGAAAPLNARVLDLIRRAERTKSGQPGLRVSEIRISGARP